MKWVAGNLYEQLEVPVLARVGILNLDEYGGVGNRSAEADFPLIRGLVQRGLERSGAGTVETLAEAMEADEKR